MFCIHQSNYDGITASNLEAWSHISNHALKSRSMVPYLKSQPRISRHGPISRIIASNLEAWSSISNHGLKSRIMASNFKAWFHISKHGIKSRGMVPYLESRPQTSNLVRILSVLPSNRSFYHICRGHSNSQISQSDWYSRNPRVGPKCGNTFQSNVASLC